MPLRVALNVAYAMLTDGLDAKEREKFDEQLYGWGDLNIQANRALRGGVDEQDESGGEG